MVPKKMRNAPTSLDNGHDGAECDNSNHNEKELLDKWVHHNSLEFHSLSRDEAAQIRSRLLDWYRLNRRQLPWRGDPPPWRGSTANFVADRSAAKQQSPSRSKQQQQTTMSQYFSKTNKRSTSSQPKTTDPPAEEKQQQQQYPVTAYGVWVSEIMLQQTRVEAVIPYWLRWMTTFPTVQALAAATPEQVNAHWSGLGFYRRARLLHAAAQYVVKTFDGIIPTTVAGLEQLPGVGRYTASAIASIAYSVNVPVVDGNVCRVLSRLRGVAQNVKAGALKDKYGWDLAAQIVQAGDHDAGEVNQALMELGATYCAPSGTGVDELDPLRDFYRSTRLGREAGALFQQGGWSAIDNLLSSRSVTDTSCPVCATNGVEEALTNMCTSLETMESSCCDNNASEKCGHAALPLAPEKTAKREDVLAVAVISYRDNDDPMSSPSWLLVRRPDTGLLAGQWEFPNSCCWSSNDVTGPDGDKKNKGKRKDMSDQVPAIPAAKRCKALKTMLQELLASQNNDIVLPLNVVSSLSLKQLEAPIEHIFSHVRHTMWVEHNTISISEMARHCKSDHATIRSWVDSKGREVRWMDEDEMKSVGVTSGVKKVLNVVKGKEGLTAKPKASVMNSTTKKRRISKQIK